jgi:hypothetical protein
MTATAGAIGHGGRFGAGPKFATTGHLLETPGESARM